MTRPALHLLGALLLCASGCAGRQNAVVLERVAVPRLRSVGIEQDGAERVRSTIQGELRRLAPEATVPPEQVDRAATSISACQQPEPEHQEDCALRVSRKLLATHVLVGAVGGLGRTQVLQLRLLEVKRGAALRSLEETVFGERGALTEAVGPMMVRLLGVERPRPWYTRWWLWAGVGAAIATAIALPLALHRDDPFEELQLPLRGR